LSAVVRRRKKLRSLPSRLGRLAVVLLLAWGLLATLALFGLRFVNPPITSVQLQRRLEAGLQPAPIRPPYRFVPLAEISDDLEHAVIVAEDGRFYDHHGIDWFEVRQVVNNGANRGASTITQQLVKNLFLTTHRSLLRKVPEVPLALLADLVLSKRRILELYLNLVEWGPGIFGAEAAARHHYGIGAQALGREQAARLAACLPAPRRRRPQQMDESAARILRRMQARGW
jgi:monofunctional biosynthetic peptidoglycan transglycosylase